MKILFAVSNENVSDAIVKSYQRNYNATVTHKNVFYFNAIIKEIQRDRDYDRIIISEDLEPFANNNYDAIDKFIFERLENISNGINGFSDKRIPIILICTDRRTKSSQMIVRLFNIGIYDAVIGSDRKIENVCKLINEPRTKEEAQQYYKIPNDKNGQNSIEDVSEEEVQNILNYYKKLEKNEDKFTDSFNNIASQYTDAQLKIIIRYLPINVKAVLETECAKYQELVTYANNPESAREQREKERIRQQKQMEREVEAERVADAVQEKQKKERRLFGRKNTNKEQSTDTQYVPTNSSSTQARDVSRGDSMGIDLLERKLNDKGVQGNVVIPNAINTRDARKALSNDEMNLESNRSIRPETISRPQPQPQVQPQSQPQSQAKSQSKANQINQGNTSNNSATLPGFEDIDSSAKGNVVTPVNNVRDEDSIEEENKNSINIKTKQNNSESLEQVATNESVEPAKRGRGRPRKNPLPEETIPKPKGKRGRPRKNPLPEETQEDMPRVETVSTVVTNPIQETTNSAILPGMEELNIGPNLQETESITTLPGFETEKITQKFSSFDTFNTDNTETQESTIENDTETTLPGFDNDDFKDVNTTNETSINNNYDIPEDDLINEGSITDTTNTGTTTLPGIDMEPEDSTIEPVRKAENNLQDFNAQNSLEQNPITQNSSAQINQVQTSSTLPGFNDDYQDQELTSSVSTATSYRDSDNRRRSSIKKLEEKVTYSTGTLESVLTKDKKIVAFIGTSKNGTSFIVNNLASLFSSIGVKTAILDMTQNRNAYYIYTNNDENLRQISYKAIENLENGICEGIKADRNLNVFTAVPNEESDFSNAEAILTTLAKNESLVLIDCDFDTPFGYFANAQEIYLVQSMDILTIQPLTAFLRELKANGILDPDKLRVVVNKELKVKGLTSKTIIGGMSFYNDPSMSYMTELFDKNKIKACTLPFEDSTYSKYLETLVNCNVSISGYSKNFMNSLKILGNMVYPLSSKQTYTNSGPDYSKSNFSAEMNNTLNQMKNKY